MQLTKSEMVAMLHEAFPNGAVKEGVNPSYNQNVVPRAIYWEYVWEDVSASGDDYSDLNTYQVSIFHTKPPRENTALLNFRQLLRQHHVHPQIFHEYNSQDGLWHSYMSLQVTE